MDIIIGRDATTSQLNITIGQQQQRIGQPSSVPMTVSRRHCKISVSPEGTMTIENLKAENSTWVNGSQVVKKRLAKGDTVALGPDKYRIDLGAILAIVDKARPKTADIRPLKLVYTQHEQFLLNHQISQNRFNALASASGIFTLGAVLITAINGIDMKWKMMLYVPAFILVLASVIIRLRNSKWPMKQKAENDEFHKRYACPNCHHTFSQPYDILTQSDFCPFCKAKFIK